jgi:hypothetical protein
VVTRIEYAIEHRDIALCAFLDSEGAFDRTSFDIIKQAAERHGIDPTICRWICAMLESRNIMATLSGETLGAPAVRGCPQGGWVLSPLMWSLVVDDLLWELNHRGYYTVGHANDIAILIYGKFPQTVSEVLQTALHSPTVVRKDKVVHQPNQDGSNTLYKKEKFKGSEGTSPLRRKVSISTEVKYLGIILDKGLTWR